MKRTLEEILENIPELDEEREKLSEVIDVLEKNNPQILPSVEFKNSLRERLQGLIKLKQDKKRFFVVFAVPVFSFLFIITGFFYYLDKIELIGGNKNINIDNIERNSVQDSQIQKVQDLGDISNLQESITDNEIDNNTNADDSLSQSTQNENINKQEEVISNQKKLESKVQTYDNKNNQTDQTLLQEISNPQEQPKDNNNHQIEDEQIIDVFDALEEEFGDIFGDSNFDSQQNNVGINGILPDESGSADTMFMKRTYIELDFGTYCSQQGGILSGTGEVEKCIINNNECMASDFQNGICEFSEIK